VWQDVEGAQVATLPHPSGLCREWNDEATREAARTFLRGELLQPDEPVKRKKGSDRLTLREAAEELGTTYGALRVRVHRGTLPVEREGRHVYVRREDVA
jgi:excisionase family DNA binding protein